MFDGNLDQRFRLFGWLFVASGVPFHDIRYRARLYSFYRIFALGCGYITLITTWVDSFNNIDNMDIALQSIRPGLAMVNVLWSHIFISTKMNGLRNLLEMCKGFTWSDLPSRSSETGALTMAGWIPRIHTFSFRLSMTIITFHLFYLVLRIAMKSENILFFNAWFPFDVNYMPAYLSVILVQGLGSIVFGSLIFGLMGLYSMLVAVGCTQLQKIQAALIAIRAEDIPISETHNHFVECVKHHQLVLRFMKELEDTFNLALLGPFLTVGITMCFAAVTALTNSGSSAELVQVVLLIVAMMSQILAFCWFGTELTTESGRVLDAAYESKWIGSPVPFQKSLKFVMAASTEFTLTAGKIIPVNRRTMMKILNETYSYVMFLMNFVNTPKTNN